MENPYQLNGLLSDDSFENTVLPMYATWKTGQDWPLYDTASRVTDLGGSAQLSDFPYLHRAGMSEGYDDKGQYISLHDVWDYNTAVKGKDGDNIGKWVGGKPFDVYQRYYLDDWLDIPEEARGNPYIAPSYIESYIESDDTGSSLPRNFGFNGLPNERGEWAPPELFASGGKFIRAPKYNNGTARFIELLDDYASMPYQPYEPSVPEVRTPIRYEPQPHYGLYEYPASTGLVEAYPITVSGVVAAPVVASEPEEVVEDLFSEEAMARRALKQRYAESNFDNKAKSHAGAIGAWQIMPITYKDYLGRGRGKAGDLNDPEYNRKVRDWVMGIIPRDLRDLYSENDAPRVKLAKIYGAYNWGAGNMRKYLRKQREAGVDISNDTSWVDGLNPETKRYIKYLALDEDIPDSTYTNKAFEEAAAKRGYKEAYPGFKQYGPGGALGLVNPNIVRNAVKNAVLSVLPMSVSKGLSSVASLTRGDLRGAPLKDYYDYGVQEDWNPEQGFLMSPTKQQKYMEEIGYHKVDDSSYGMVDRAATELGKILGTTIPIYQLGGDDISPENVKLVSTNPDEVRPYFERLVNSKSERLLRDPGSHPSALYKDSNGNYYLKSWDLNDYGQHGRRSSGTTYGVSQALAELYDYIGTPFVQRTGLIRVPTEEEMPVYDKSKEKAVQDFAELYRERIANGEFSSGGSIHIKPSHRGRLTELKARTGKSEAELYNDGNHAHKKMVVFARNARKWHGDGGLLDKFSSVYGNDRARMLDAIRKIRMNRFDGNSKDTGQMRRAPFWQRMVQGATMAEAPAVMTAAGMEVNPDGTITYGNDSEGVRQLRDNLAVIGATGLGSFLGGSGLLYDIGKSAAVGIDTMGRMAMPSTFLKGVATYVPKAAGALEAASPWLDAGALSLWSAKAGQSAIDAGRHGDAGTATAMGTMALMPLIPIAPSLTNGTKDIRFGLSNLNEYRKLLKDPENYMSGLKYARDKYAARADVLDRNMKLAAGYTIDEANNQFLPRIIKERSVLDNLPEVSLTHPFTGWMKKYVGKTDQFTGSITLNPWHKKVIQEAWKNPRTALQIVDADGGAHEGTHWALKKLGANTLSRPGTIYYEANPNHPLFQEVTWQFSDPNRIIGAPTPFKEAWMRSPEEFVAEMTNKEYYHGIPFNQTYPQWDLMKADKINNFLGKRFSFPKEDAGEIARRFSLFGFKNGGKMKN
jgi:hypothetical protein